MIIKKSLQGILNIALASGLMNLSGCGKEIDLSKIKMEFLNDTLRVENVWMRSDGTRIVEYLQPDGSTRILNQGVYYDPNDKSQCANRINVRYTTEKDRYLILEYRIIENWDDLLIFHGKIKKNSYTLCLPRDFRIPGVSSGYNEPIWLW